MHASRGRPVEPFHSEPVGGLGTASSLRSLKKLPRGRTNAGLFGYDKGRGFEETFFVAERKVGRGEFHEPGRHAFLRDKRCPGEIVSEPELRLEARTACASDADEFCEQVGFLLFKKALGGGSELRDR